MHFVPQAVLWTNLHTYKVFPFVQEICKSGHRDQPLCTQSTKTNVCSQMRPNNKKLLPLKNLSFDKKNNRKQEQLCNPTEPITSMRLGLLLPAQWSNRNRRVYPHVLKIHQTRMKAAGRIAAHRSLSWWDEGRDQPGITSTLAERCTDMTLCRGSSPCAGVTVHPVAGSRCTLCLEA